jgi:hypothetical protein
MKFETLCSYNSLLNFGVNIFFTGVTSGYFKNICEPVELSCDPHLVASHLHSGLANSGEG